jgi:hypothetical protein
MGVVPRQRGLSDTTAPDDRRHRQDDAGAARRE